MKSTPKKRRRKWLFAALLLIGSTLIALVAAEIVLRAIIKGHLDILASRVRRPEMYSSWLDDDYWKLYTIMGGEHRPPANPHPLLGYVGQFDRETLLHNEVDKVGERRPVLMYGDSYGACTTEKRFQELLNEDPEFSKGYYLLNYSNAGYGLGQIYLAMTNSVDLYERPVVILSLMTLDLDRALMSYRGAQKPCFEIVDGKVRQNPIPIYNDPYTFLKEHPPSIHSYFFSLLLRSRYAPRVLQNLFDRDPEFRDARTVSAFLIEQSVAFLRSRNVPFLVVVFHPHLETDRHASWNTAWLFGEETSWRSEVIYGTLKSLDAPYVSARDLVRADAKKTGSQRYEDYFRPADAHPNAHYNDLVTAEIKRFVLSLPDSPTTAALPLSGAPERERTFSASRP